MVDTVTYNPSSFTVIGNLIPKTLSFTATHGTLANLGVRTIDGHSLTRLQVTGAF